MTPCAAQPHEPRPPPQRAHRQPRRTALAVVGSWTSLLTFIDHAHFTNSRRELLTYR